MIARRFAVSLILVVAATVAACLEDRTVGPDEPLLPAVMAVDRPTVQLFRYAMGIAVEKDTVRITNNGEGPLGRVEQIGGVDYLTPARAGWLRTEVREAGPDQWLLILTPTYAEEEQEAADTAEIVLRAEGSPELKRVTVIAQTLRGASFEFSVNPVSFSAVSGDSASSQEFSVRNSGNGSLTIRPPSVHPEGAGAQWLSVTLSGGTGTAPRFKVSATPGTLGGDSTYLAYLVFESGENEETRAKPDSLKVQLNIGKPRLGVSTSTLAFTAIRGASPPSAQTILISNAGSGTFSSLGELTLSPPAQSVSGTGWLEAKFEEGRPDKIIAQVQTLGLPADTLEASFSVNSDLGGSRTIEVVLSVESPILEASSRDISFGSTEGESPPPPAIVTLSNKGPGTFNNLGKITVGPPGGDEGAANWLKAEYDEGRPDTLVLVPQTAGLAAGVYNDTVPLNSEFGGSDMISVVLAISRGVDDPVLVLSPTTLAFNGVRGEPSPAPQTVQISNVGGGSLGKVSVGTIQPVGQTSWLSASVADSTLTLSVTTGSLPAGVYSATVQLLSASGDSADLKVNFAVGAPVLTLEGASVSFSMEEQEDPPPPGQAVRIRNTGGGSFGTLGTLSQGAFNPSVNWLVAAIDLDKQEVILTPTESATDLIAGKYSTRLLIQSANGGSSSIAATLTVTRRPSNPSLSASPSVIRMAAMRGENPPVQTIRLTNDGGGVFEDIQGLPSSVTSGWLTGNLVNQVVTLSAEASSLGVGTHVDTINITSTNGGTASISAELTVGAPVLTLEWGSVGFSVEDGQKPQPGARTVQIFNTGDGSFGSLDTLSLGDLDPQVDWLEASLDLDAEAVVLTPTDEVSDLPDGFHSTRVPIESTYGGAGAIVVVVSVTTSQVGDPLLALIPGSVSFSDTEDSGGGGPGSATVQVENIEKGGAFEDLGTVTVDSVTYSPDGETWLTPSDVANQSLVLDAESSGLSPGLYEATVWVSSEYGGSDRRVEVGLTIRPRSTEPHLALSAQEVDFSAIRGAGSPPPITIQLQNLGGGLYSDLGDLSVSGIDYPGIPEGWLGDPQPSQGELTFSPATAGLTGTHSATVRVASDFNEETVVVNVTVLDPVLTASKLGVSFRAPEGSNPTEAQTVTLKNTGAGTPGDLGSVTVNSVSFGPGAGGWLKEPKSGALVANETLGFEVLSSQLDPGTYEATVLVSSEHGGEQSIDVTLSVVRDTDPPRLVLSKSALRFGAMVGSGSPAPQVVLVSNGGGGSLGAIQVGAIAPPGAEAWLDGSPMGDTVTVRVDSRDLTEGVYSATLSVLGERGGEGTVEITFEVLAPRLTLTPQRVSLQDTVSGTGPKPIRLAISNTGGGTFSSLDSIWINQISFGAGAPRWLQARLAAKDSVEIQALTDSIPAPDSTYTALVPVTSRFGGTDTTKVSFRVASGPSPAKLGLSPDSITFVGIWGGDPPASQTVAGFNNGGGTLDSLWVQEFIPESADAWLSDSVSVSDFSVTLQPSISELTPGLHHATVVVSAGGLGSAEPTLDTLQVVVNLGRPNLHLSSDTVLFSAIVGSADTLLSGVFLSNSGSGSFGSLGQLSVDSIFSVEGNPPWLTTNPEKGGVIPGNAVELSVTAAGLSAGTYLAFVAVRSEWGGSDTIRVALSVREPDRSFDLPIIELVQVAEDPVTGERVVVGPLTGNVVVVNIPPDSVHVDAVGVRKKFETRLPLSGLRVGTPSYKPGQPGGWITGAFLDRTDATRSKPAILFVVLEPRGLVTGDYEASLEVRSEGLGLPYPTETLTVILQVR